MAIGDPYATLSELKDTLKIPDGVDDVQLELALAAISRDIETYCKRQFNQTTTASARVFRPRRSDSLDVDDFHTTTDLAVATDPGWDGSFSTALDPATYQLEPRNGIVNGVPGWPFSRLRWRHVQYRHPYSGRRPEVQVTAQWGWAAVPDGVHQACLLLASELFKLREAPFGVAAYGDYGPVRVRQNPMACALLHPYRVNPVMVG
jgi:hypothetical protein